MTILHQSSKALDRSLGEWFVQIQAGAIKLPRFQRFEAWDRWRIVGFLNTVLQNLPVGVTLLLQVGDKEKFVSRYVATAPQTGARVTEHLLDGQQRLTAFWRAVHNNYEDETYFVYIPQFDVEATIEVESEEMAIHCEPRWTKTSDPQTRYPAWANLPAHCLKRGLVPFHLLCPGDRASEMEAWIQQATLAMKPNRDDPDAWDKLENFEKLLVKLRSILASLRERVAHFNLPFLSLPVSTNADVALQVFVNMNTNSQALSIYDLTVAKVESVAGKSLHEAQERLEEAHVELTHYGELAPTLLNTAALLQGKMPNKGGVGSMNMQLLMDNWELLAAGLVRATNLLKRERIFDSDRLPSLPVVAVIAACLANVPIDGDALGRAEQLMRAYMWSSFLTNRYESGVPTRAFQDYKALVELLARPHFTQSDYDHVPALRRVDHPLPSLDQLVRAGWPATRDRLARSIMAINLHFGALDFADGHEASYESLRKREYHHIFPDALLAEADINSWLALNCALVTWKTNRTIGRKDPLNYLEDRVEWADVDVVSYRLRTHLLAYKTLSQATYDNAGQPLRGEALTKKLKTDFDNFLLSRAALVALAAEQLASGRILAFDTLIAEAIRAGGASEAAAEALIPSLKADG